MLKLFVSGMFEEGAYQTEKVQWLIAYYTRQKTPSPLLNRIEQCFAAHVVHTCQQY